MEPYIFFVINFVFCWNRWPGDPARRTCLSRTPGSSPLTRTPRVLLQLTVSSRSIDYLVYKARAVQPPSLSLLPTPRSPGRPSASCAAAARARSPWPSSARLVAFELCVLLSLGPGPSESDKWELRHVKVRDGRGKDMTLQCWETDAAVPVGGRFLCWVDCYRGMLVGRVFADGGSALTYVPLHVDTLGRNPTTARSAPRRRGASASPPATR
ncbi:uncharacterized protein LOC123450311 [Hordeum vulgare subsp. vulgare]|uniref:uncharacterized protein LOC123450311 n=1 Tax=Hordeum vulgare subsp. vulgare TaxID=112509 RepID=UPI001D1A450C|nr:uncharacterized protein LOC123450311 [Hordeum vulgare subsp. vulgare]